MFNVTGSEILILLVLALVVVGPERLPDLARKFAKSYGELKKMSTGFQTELRDALDEPLREMRSTADQLRKTIEDPINETIASGTDAVKGNVADTPNKSSDTSPSKNGSDTSIDPVLAAESGAEANAARTVEVFADTAEPVASSPFDAAVSSASPKSEPATESPVRPTSPFDTAVSSASPRSHLAVIDDATTQLPPPSGAAALPPPSATATAFLPPPTTAQAADPLTAPETPSE